MTHTLTEVREIAARLLADKGEDFIYNTQPGPDGVYSCRYYTIDGQPSCFVGHVIDIWGDKRIIDAAKAADVEGNTDAKTVIARVSDDCDGDVLDYLNYVQDRQDSGVPWGEAILMAEHIVGLHPEPVCVPNCAICEETR